jgi:hypothetical protein
MLATILFRIFYLLISSPKNVKIRLYKTIILPVVFYGSGTWPVTLKVKQIQSILRVGWCGEYLDPWQRKWQEAGWTT